MAKRKKTTTCPCDTGLPLAQCCEPLLNNELQAKTTLALMRSRYCAYTLGDEDYLLRTWHSDTRPLQLSLQGNQQHWQRLKIIDTTAGQADDDNGEVEFVAIYKINGRAERLHERSRFTREGQQWRYVDGAINDNPATSE
ncbi:MAG: hypothetical protein COA75_00350 [Cellvibrionales bacterium]|nr:MAG: hypothetical protein COA75_00350 [Cellvibrionales bacterium]